MFDHDTICALSTVQGRGAIAVIRMSGERSIEIASSIFKPLKGAPLEESKSHTLRFGHIYKGEELIDEVLLSLFRAPNSYTGEEMVEISCHGSLYIQQEILMLLVAKGARLAGPGEFSQRAFLNGKMDLAQAEAVADLIASENSAAHRVAISQMKGGFSTELAQMRSSLLEAVSLMELELDFSEEDVEFAERSQLTKLIEGVIEHISELIASFKLGNVIKNGIPVAIVGATNTGKSTLLNLLLKEERSIVSDIHGTTRDYIEGYLNLEGVGFRIIDTAGIRESTEKIELIGIERSYQKIKEASVILLMLDALREENFEMGIRQLSSVLEGEPKSIIVLLNKCDKLTKEQLKRITEQIERLCKQEALPNKGVLPISAREGVGMERLQSLLLQSSSILEENHYPTLVSNVRHYEALVNTSASLKRVIEGLNEGLATDLVAQEIREALYYLGQIVGTINTEEILGAIFSKFCIGK